MALGGIWCDSGDLSAQEKDPGTSRWEPQIQEIEKKIQSGQSPRHSIVFVGSSSIRLWDLKSAFPDRPTSNHGFGGSQLSDAVQLFDRIVPPVEPQAVVLYAGDNDIGAGHTADEVVQEFERFVAACKERLNAGTPVLFIAIKPSLKRWSMAEAMQEANQRIAAQCEQDSQLFFVDIWSPMLTKEGMPQPDLFREDGLHLNQKGYKVWNSLVAKTLQTALPATEAGK